MTENYTFAELCDALGKSSAYVRNLQRILKIHVPGRNEFTHGTTNGCDNYPEGYFRFLQKVVALRTFNVPTQDIHALFEKEKKILELLHFDSMTESPTWYLDSCGLNGDSVNHLLLTGFDLGFPITAEVIQSNLDFRERERELFARVEMGEDVKYVMSLYLKTTRRIMARVRSEEPVLRDALTWAAGVLHYLKQ